MSAGAPCFSGGSETCVQPNFKGPFPGGKTYIGGGFGSRELKAHVIEEMAKIDPSWDCYAKKKSGDDGIRRFERMFDELNCSDYQIIDDDTGFWIVLSKKA